MPTTKPTPQQLLAIVKRMKDNPEVQAAIDRAKKEVNRRFQEKLAAKRVNLEKS